MTNAEPDANPAANADRRAVEQAAGAAAAAELRLLLADLHGTDASTEALTELTAAVRAARAQLADQPRRDRRASWSEFSLFAGSRQALALPMATRVESVDGHDVIVGEAIVNAMYEGPPGAVHGGYLAGLFDDLLGHTLRLHPGARAVTGRLTVRYRKPTPLDTPLRFEARLDNVSGRRLQSTVRCLVDGVVTAEAQGLFVGVTQFVV